VTSTAAAVSASKWISPPPPRRQPVAASDIEEVLDQLAAAGSVSRASLARTDWKWEAPGLGLEPGTTRKLIDELRSDR